MTESRWKHVFERYHPQISSDNYIIWLYHPELKQTKKKTHMKNLKLSVFSHYNNDIVCMCNPVQRHRMLNSIQDLHNSSWWKQYTADFTAWPNSILLKQEGSGGLRLLAPWATAAYSQNNSSWHDLRKVQLLALVQSHDFEDLICTKKHYSSSVPLFSEEGRDAFWVELKGSGKRTLFSIGQHWHHVLVHSDHIFSAACPYVFGYFTCNSITQLSCAVFQMALTFLWPQIIMGVAQHTEGDESKRGSLSSNHTCLLLCC